MCDPALCAGTLEAKLGQQTPLILSIPSSLIQLDTVRLMASTALGRSVSARLGRGAAPKKLRLPTRISCRTKLRLPTGRSSCGAFLVELLPLSSTSVAVPAPRLDHHSLTIVWHFSKARCISPSFSEHSLNKAFRESKAKRAAANASVMLEERINRSARQNEPKTDTDVG